MLVPIDFLFLGLVAKGFFTSQVGDMLGTIRLAPVVLFYMLYAVGILILRQRAAAGCNDTIELAVWRLVRGLCSLRDVLELTALSLLKHWTLLPVVPVDISLGNVGHRGAWRQTLGPARLPTADRARKRGKRGKL